MKETGIIMSGDHPKLILDGTKTMTRRTRGLEIINLYPNDWHPVWNDGDLWAFSNKAEEDALTLKCPYGQVGDRLWVRETWKYYNCSDLIAYKADGDLQGRWKPAIHMFRKYSRIQMPIDLLRPERLQEITEEDAIAEGIQIAQGTWQAMGRDSETGRPILVGEPQPYTARYHFQALWDSTNGKKYPWSGNWWVWVIGWREILSVK